MPVLVLLSGGLDSAVLAAQLREAGRLGGALFIDYGQLWAVCGHGTPREAFWYRALIGEVPALDLPDRTKDQRHALLAALPVPS